MLKLTIKSAVMVALLSLMSTGAIAHSNPDEVSICYVFKNDKMVHRDTCIELTHYPSNK